MKNYELFQILGGIDEGYIQAAREKMRKHRLYRMVPAAACAVLVLLSAAAVRHFQAGTLPDPVPGSASGIVSVSSASTSGVSSGEMPPHNVNIVVNKLQNMDSAALDADVELYNHDKLPYDVWQKILVEFQEFTGITYDNFIARIPDSWEGSGFYSVKTRGYKDNWVKEYNILHDYVLNFRSEQGGEATIAICNFEKPLRDYFFTVKDPALSKVNGIPLTVYSLNGAYIAQFSYLDANYDIETSGIGLEELAEFLAAILTEA